MAVPELGEKANINTWTITIFRCDNVIKSQEVLIWTCGKDVKMQIQTAGLTFDSLRFFEYLENKKNDGV